jgi:predicted CoA-substrate-specific enzyme activase
MAWFVGIDIGSTATKGVVIGDSGIHSSHVISSGVNYRTVAQTLREELLATAKLTPGDITRIATTGHGAHLVPFSDLEVLDVECCARGISYLSPSVRTIIDVQDLSSQVIRLNEKGKVIDLAQGESCASGGGYFFRVIANILQVDLKDIGAISLQSNNPVTFTTGCSVFAESEAISRVSEGFSQAEILAGVHKALVERIFALVNKVGMEEPCAISGGGGLNVGLIKRIEEKGIRLLVPSQPLMVNALGAALVVKESKK